MQQKNAEILKTLRKEIRRKKRQVSDFDAVAGRADLNPARRLTRQFRTTVVRSNRLSRFARVVAYIDNRGMLHQLSHPGNLPTPCCVLIPVQEITSQL